MGNTITKIQVRLEGFINGDPVDITMTEHVDIRLDYTEAEHAEDSVFFAARRRVELMVAKLYEAI